MSKLQLDPRTLAKVRIRKAMNHLRHAADHTLKARDLLQGVRLAGPEWERIHRLRATLLTSREALSSLQKSRHVVMSEAFMRGDRTSDYV
jgi:hypothetical protein